jgi:hypothetical protein
MRVFKYFCSKTRMDIASSFFDVMFKRVWPARPSVLAPAQGLDDALVYCFALNALHLSRSKHVLLWPVELPGLS